ncbi:hypothetical protein MRX96_032604 [Rhipicephalus microplus]
MEFRKTVCLMACAILFSLVVEQAYGHAPRKPVFTNICQRGCLKKCCTTGDGKPFPAIHYVKFNVKRDVQRSFFRANKGGGCVTIEKIWSSPERETRRGVYAQLCPGVLPHRS